VIIGVCEEAGVVGEIPKGADSVVAYVTVDGNFKRLFVCFV